MELAGKVPLPGLHMNLNQLQLPPTPSTLSGSSFASSDSPRAKLFDIQPVREVNERSALIENKDAAPSASPLRSSPQVHFTGASPPAAPAGVCNASAGTPATTAVPEAPPAAAVAAHQQSPITKDAAPAVLVRSASPKNSRMCTKCTIL
jgi:hypothetical protein